MSLGAQPRVSMITEARPQAPQGGQTVSTYRVDIAKLTNLTQQPRQLLDAYAQCLGGKTFAAGFYNYITASDRFQRVTCGGFQDLHKKAVQQQEDVQRIVCMAELLNKTLGDIADQRSKNRTFLTEILLRQLQINLSIISRMSTKSKIDPQKLQARL